MTTTHHLTALIEREGDGYVALCPELDIASQGDTVEESQRNLREALALFFEEASSSEVEQRSHSEVYVTRIEVAVPDHRELRIGTLQSIIRQSRLPRSLFETD